MNPKDYQNHIYHLLQTKLNEVEKEWIAFKGNEYHNQYSPRVDIAVGPFSIEQERIWEYNDLVEQGNIRFFLHRVYDFHVENIRNMCSNEITIPIFNELIIKNQNARCFLAFEIENKTSRKHILGSIVNAASLGRVGVGIAYSEKVLITFIRILNYLGFLKPVEKNTYDTTNFLIITKEQMLTLVYN